MKKKTQKSSKTAHVLNLIGSTEDDSSEKVIQKQASPGKESSSQPSSEPAGGPDWEAEAPRMELPQVDDTQLALQIQDALSDQLLAEIRQEEAQPKANLPPWVSQPRPSQKARQGPANQQPPSTEGDAPVAETPVTETPVAETPVTESPVAEAPVPETPVAETPVAEAPVTETPVTETPVAETPVAETPVAETPVAETPVAETPVAEAPVAEAPVAETPVAEAPVAETPVAETPVAETPVTEAPVAEAPVTETPVAEAPVAEAPVAETPVAEAPVAETPVTETPVAETSVTESPVIETPVAEAPVAEAPSPKQEAVVQDFQPPSLEELEQREAPVSEASKPEEPPATEEDGFTPFQAPQASSLPPLPQEAIEKEEAVPSPGPSSSTSSPEEGGGQEPAPTLPPFKPGKAAPSLAGAAGNDPGALAQAPGIFDPLPEEEEGEMTPPPMPSPQDLMPLMNAGEVVPPPASLLDPSIYSMQDHESSLSLQIQDALTDELTAQIMEDLEGSSPSLLEEVAALEGKEEKKSQFFPLGIEEEGHGPPLEFQSLIPSVPATQMDLRDLNTESFDEEGELDLPLDEGNSNPILGKKLGEPVEYYNMTEVLVREMAPRFLQTFGNCVCEQCLLDVIAHALSNLPPRYMVRHQSGYPTIYANFKQEFSSTVVAQLGRSCIVINESPRHVGY